MAGLLTPAVRCGLIALALLALTASSCTRPEHGLAAGRVISRSLAVAISLRLDQARVEAFATDQVGGLAPLVSAPLRSSLEEQIAVWRARGQYLPERVELRQVVWMRRSPGRLIVVLMVRACVFSAGRPCATTVRQTEMVFRPSNGRWLLTASADLQPEVWK